MEDDDGYLSVAYGNMAGLFVEAMKQLNSGLVDAHKEIAENHRKIDNMKNEMAEMQKKIAELMENMG